MKSLIALMLVTATTFAWAQGPTCEAAAAAKKLTGAAKAQFIQKCEADVKAKLVVASKEKKTTVAPTNSYGHCEHDGSDL